VNAEIHHRVADQHRHAVRFYLRHATLDRMAGREKLATEMDKLAESERDREADELHKAEEARSR